MVTKKNVCILKFNSLFEPEETCGGDVIKYIYIVPKTLEVFESFNYNKIVGKASKIKKKKDGIYCNLEYDDGKVPYSNAYASIKYYDDTEKSGFKKSELMSISVGITPHAQLEIRNNLE